MKLKLLTLAVICITVQQTVFAQPQTNKGTEFWTGFGYQENMKNDAAQFDTSSSGSGAHFSLYISTDSIAANVLVELPGILNAVSFPRSVVIPPFSVANIGGFPVGSDHTNSMNMPDCRLYTTGISSKGIHIVSTNGAPIACWIHDWANNNSAAASLLIPINFWSSDYIAQSYGGASTNTGLPNSFFFVIAGTDSTQVTITPTADIIDSVSSPIIRKLTKGTVKYPKGIPFKVFLKKRGDIFNAIGWVDSLNNSVVTNVINEDLTGTTIVADSGKKIAVFGGNGRTLINTRTCSGNISGSDNLIQQMFPEYLWGTKYITVPLKDMAYNMFRIMVKDSTTKVKVNQTIYSTKSIEWISEKKVYEFSTSTPLNIETDKPVSVIQYSYPGQSCGGASIGNSSGDPEMIVLTPVNRAINLSTVFCPPLKSGSTGLSYINVIVPSYAIDSFNLDGVSSLAFVKHGADTNYSYARINVSFPATHVLFSRASFTAIAYGIGNGESWGYNIGINAAKNIADSFPLPVKLGSFNVNRFNLYNTVNWRTFSETNASHFNIQRSTNGKEFTTIGKVNAKGASEYNFIDQAPLSPKGVLYYRLETVDKDGSKTYSEIRQVIMDKAQLIIAPNPAKDYVTITGSNIKQVKLLDNMGRVVVVKEANNTPINIPVSHLPKGLYMVQAIYTDGSAKTEKVVVK